VLLLVLNRGEQMILSFYCNKFVSLYCALNKTLILENIVQSFAGDNGGSRESINLYAIRLFFPTQTY
jgi:hypothetical protein